MSMMIRAVVAICSIVLAVAGRTVAGEPLSRKGKHFQLVCHIQDEKLADEALKTLEATWPVAAEMYGVENHEVAKQPTVHLYSHQAEYEEADRRLSGGAFRENLAFTNYKSNSAHVLLQPPCSEDVLNVVELPAQTRRLLAHEATHLAGHARVDQYETLPQWIIDGAAISIAQKVMKRMKASPSATADPNLSTLMIRGQQLLAKENPPSINSVLKNEMNGIGRLDQYALRWLTYKFMQEGTGEKQFMMSVQKAISDPEFRPKLMALGETEVHGQPLKDIFPAYVKRFRPEWDEVYRSLETAGKEWTQIAFPEKNAIAWRTNTRAEDSFEISGRAKILPGDTQQLNLLLGRSATGFISVAFVANHGVTVFRYDSKKDEWSRLGDGKSDSVVSARFFRFKVAYQDGKLAVSTGNKEVLSVPIESAKLSGPWGLGAQAGAAGIWKDLEAPGLGQE